MSDVADRIRGRPICDKALGDLVDALNEIEALDSDNIELSNANVVLKEQEDKLLDQHDEDVVKIEQLQLLIEETIEQHSLERCNECNAVIRMEYVCWSCGHDNSDEEASE